MRKLDTLIPGQSVCSLFWGLKVWSRVTTMCESQWGIKRPLKNCVWLIIHSTVYRDIFSGGKCMSASLVRHFFWQILCNGGSRSVLENYFLAFKEAKNNNTLLDILLSITHPVPPQHIFTYQICNLVGIILLNLIQVMDWIFHSWCELLGGFLSFSDVL